MFLAGCASVGPEATSSVLMKIEGLATGTLPTMPAVVEIGGQPAALYVTADGRLVFQRGLQKQFLDTDAPVKGGNRFQLNKDGSHIYAQWWSHENEKNLYFTSTLDSGKSFAPVSIVNDNHGILSPHSFLRGEDGTIGMTYHDERLPRFQAYSNRSKDHGLTWSRPDTRLDVPPAGGESSTVQNPVGIELDKTWFVAWVDSVTLLGKTRNRILTTRSIDTGLHWTTPEVIFESELNIASLTVKGAGRTVVIAVAEAEQGIQAFVSQDAGAKWQGSGLLAGTAALAGTDGSSNSGIQMQISQGYAHLTWMTAHRTMKTRIMRGRLNLATASWQGQVARLDVKPYENTQSLLPTLLATPGGTLLAAWVDYRDIRPNIYLSWSSDKGENWSTPSPLEQSGSASFGLPRLVQWGDDVAIAYESYPTDRIREGQFFLRLLPVRGASVVLPRNTEAIAVTAEERKALLIKRVNDLWTSRIADDYKVSYGMFDFAYRAVVTEKNYISSVGVMTYLSYEQPAVVINGNEATVTAKIKYEVQPTTLPNGRVLKLPATDAETVSTWVWVNDNWYLVFRPTPGEPTLKY